MTERENFGDIWLAASFGSIFAVAIIVAYLCSSIGISLKVFPAALYMLLIGTMLAQLSVVPLASAFGWILTRRSDATWPKAVIAGALAALLPTLAIAADGIFTPLDPGAAANAAIAGLVMATLGGVSGLIGYRAVFWNDDAS